MIVNPGIRRFLGSAIQRLFNSASVSLPLTHTAIPTRGDITPSFTRATTATGQKWDEAGYLDFTALAGEIVWKGARREYNQVSTKSADNTVGSTISANVTAATTTLTMTVANGSYWYKNSNGNAAIGRVYQCSADVSSTVDRTLCLRALATSGTNSDVQNVAITSTVQRVKLKFTADIVGVVLFGVENRVAYATDTSTTGVITFTNVSINDITGETDQTTIRPYVSVGVESAPAYHGSMVDGVKCFPTDINGVPLTTMERYKPETAATNSCLRSNAFTTAPWAALATPGASQNATGSNGQANYAWTLTDNDAANYVGYQQNNVAWAAGASGCYSILVGKKASSPSYPLLMMYYNRASNLYHYIIVNEVAGTVAIGGSTNPPAYGCVSYNDDFWLVWVSGTQAGATVLASLDIYPSGSTDGATLTSAATGSTVFAEAQFESGATVPSSRIPTTTIAVARNADVLTYTGGDIANLKTLAATFRREVGVSAAGWAATLSDGTTSNYMSVSVASATQSRFIGVSGGATQWDVIPSYTAGTQSKASFSAATNDIKMDKDGTAQTQDTNATVPAVTQLNVGHVAGSSQLNGHVGHIYGWTRNLSQSEVGAVDR